MLNIISRRDARGQIPQIRPHFPIHCVHLNPAFSLCGYPRTEQAREIWQTILGTIKADLEVQAKLLWWSVAILLIPGGTLYPEPGRGSVGVPTRVVLEEGHFDPWISCLAAWHTCEEPIDCQWLTPENSAELEPEDLELFEGTVARLVMFGNHWRKGLKRPSHGQTKHNAWRDSCYGTPNPTPAQTARVPAVLTALEKIQMDINTPPEGFDTMTPAALEVSTIKLPPNWMIWGGFALTYYHIQDNIIKNLRPFTDGLHYPKERVQLFQLGVTEGARGPREEVGDRAGKGDFPARPTERQQLSNS